MKPMKNAARPLALVTSGLLLGSIGIANGADLQPYPKQGHVVQRLDAFDNPQGAIFSADGKYVFVSNAAELGMPDKGFHWTHKGDMYALQKSDFTSGTLPPPFSRGRGGLDGLQFVGKNRVDTEVRNTNSVIVTPLPGSISFRLAFDKNIMLSRPADIAVHKMHSGSYLLVIAELSGTSPNKKNNVVTVVRLPADF
jgi:hypothetical protein